MSDWEQVGGRVREARVAAGLTQSQLAGRLSLDRSALVRIESGQRQVSALELFRLSDELGVPVAHFVSVPPPAIVSQRAEVDEDAQDTTRIRYQFDAVLEAHARDAEFLNAKGYLRPGLALPQARVAEVAAAKRLAGAARTAAGYSDGPLPGIAEVCERFGLYLLVVDLPAEGASLRLDDRLGVAVVSGHAAAGRRRFTAAHELGHHLLGDEYQSDVGVAASRDERERLIDAFAAELLLPDTEVARRWESLSGTARERLVRLAAEYRVSWRVAVSTARLAGIFGDEEARMLRADTPQRGDFLAICGTEPAEDLLPRQTGPTWRRAVLAAYHDGVITPARAIELLHEALHEAELPDREPQPQP
ncbi:MAG: ImmA/IrrE family metallo-endopeptidase [Micromonosporaceae bacterium]|nr:ImmA/IrrE family metallo-endopeptidase [Micromonosporaceae bacterium]